MKPFKLSKSSLHYRLATTYGKHYEHDDEPDLCSYIRNVIRGAFVVLLICTVAGGLIGGIMGNLLAWLAYIIFNGYTSPNEFAFMGILLMGFLVFIVVTFFIVETDSGKAIRYNIRTAVSNITGSVPKVKNDSFLKLAYRRFKNKTCVRLKLE